MRYVISQPINPKLKKDTNRKKEKIRLAKPSINLFKLTTTVLHRILCLNISCIRNKQIFGEKRTHLLWSGELAAAGGFALELPSPHDT